MQQVKMEDSYWMTQDQFSPVSLALEIKTRINDTMEANGLTRVWWRAFKEGDTDADIYPTVFKIIMDPVSEENERQQNMKAYYGRIRIKVDAYVAMILNVRNGLVIDD